eukprot:c4046_g1_i1.p1 GENE.c4046_g1_i1~~c4046_g1_i1.p1  ORF type:complete len:381 (-),score=79.05 c4046_g1_i1:55-1161(-)
MARVAFGLLVCLFVVVHCLPELRDQAALSISVGDPPGIVKKPDPPVPSEDGVVVEQVVNVKKTVVIFITSSATEEGAQRRQLIRNTWAQPLNRSSEFAFPMADRTRFTFWFVIDQSSNSTINESVHTEGQKQGDIVLVTRDSASDFHRFVSIVRWLRIAYYERYDFALFTRDDCFVSLYNLKNLCDNTISKQFFYGGFVNSFEKAPQDYGHSYYAPYVDGRTILISADIIELIALELPHIQPLTAGDATLGHFLRTYEQGKPQHFPSFVPNFKKTYSAIDSIVVAGRVDEATMRFLSNPVVVAGKWTTPTLPPQTTEFNSRTVYVDPHPKGNEPACDGFENARCSLNALKAQQDVMGAKVKAAMARVK